MYGEEDKKSSNTSSRTWNKIFTCYKGAAKGKVPIVDKPTLQYIIEECIASCIEEILMITGINDFLKTGMESIVL